MLKGWVFGLSVSEAVLKQSFGMDGWKVEAAAFVLRGVRVVLGCLMRFWGWVW